MSQENEDNLCYLEGFTYINFVVLVIGFTEKLVRNEYFVCAYFLDCIRTSKLMLRQHL